MQAADQYEVRGLHQRCVAVIQQGLMSDTVVDMLLLSERHQSNTLWDICVAYTAEKDRFATVGWSYAPFFGFPVCRGRYASPIVSVSQLHCVSLQVCTLAAVQCWAS